MYIAAGQLLRKYNPINILRLLYSNFMVASEFGGRCLNKLESLGFDNTYAGLGTVYYQTKSPDPLEVPT